MDREQAEVIQRLTARYVSEYADGNQPRLEELGISDREDRVCQIHVGA